MDKDSTTPLADESNRRKWRRSKIEMGAVLTVDPGGARLASRIANVSARGIFVQTEASADVGAHLAIHLFIPDEPLTLRGVVVRSVPTGASGKSGLGVFLTDVSERWTNFCATLSEPSLKAVEGEISGPKTGVGGD